MPVVWRVSNGLFHYEGQKLKRMQTTTLIGSGKSSVSAITHRIHKGNSFLGIGRAKKKWKKRRLFLSAPLKIVYQQGEQSQTIYFEE